MADEEQEQGNSGEFPRRQRRRLTEDSTSEPVTQPSSSDSEDSPAGGETVLPDDEPQSAGRRRRSVSEEKPEAAASTASPETVQEQTRKVAEPEKVEKKPEEAPEDASDSEEASPAQRAVRIVLILLIFAVIMGFIVLQGRKMKQAQQQAAAEQSGNMVADGPEFDFTESDKKAMALEQQLVAGQYALITEQATQLRGIAPNNPKLQRVIYRAEALKAVMHHAAILDSLPLPEADNAAIAVADNCDRIEKRLSHLSVLASQRRDWGRDLVSLSVAKPVYQKYEKEISRAATDLKQWKSGLKELQKASAGLGTAIPDDELIVRQLRTSAQRIPLAEILVAADNLENVYRAENLILNKKLDRAVKNIDAVDFRRLEALGEDVPETIVFDIQKLIKKRLGILKDRVAVWRELRDVITATAALHAEGKTAEALARIKESLPKADPKSQLTAEQVTSLSLRKEHYTKVFDTWNEALKIQKTRPLKDQLIAWAKFQRILDQKDTYYRKANQLELKKIKDIIQKDISANYDRLLVAEKGYKGFNAKMRKPESPREPFVEQAKALHDAVVIADKIKNLRAMISTWGLGDETDAQVDYAKSILADHNDQASRVWNLGKLYQRRGKIKLAKECFQRVIILGSASSNPWVAEAKKALESGK